VLKWLLDKIGVDTVSDKVHRLCCGNPEEQQSAEQELSRSRDARAIPVLMTCLTDKDPEVRGRAIHGLGLIGGAQAAEALVRALWDINHVVRKNAANGLDSLRWSPADESQRALYAFAGDREAAVQELNRRGHASTSGVIPLLSHKAKRVRGCAARFLAEYGDLRAVEPLIKLLKDEYKEIRVSAARTLGNCGDKRAVEPLTDALRDEDADVRVAAAEALGRYEDERAVEPLQRALKDDYTEVRVAAIEALGSCGDERAVEALIQAFKDNPWDAHVQSAATRSLGLIGKTRALTMLRHALQDAAGSVRRSAAEALGSLEDARAIGLLAAALKDSEYEVREEAAAALMRLGAADTVFAEINNLGSSLVIGASHRLPEPQRVDLLLRLLERGLADDDLRGICKALAAVGDERAVEPLLVRVANESAAKDAVEALRQILERRAVMVTKEVLKLIANLADNVPGAREECDPAAGPQRARAETPDIGTIKQLAANELARRNP
jgi:HEAT repeat protein